MPAKLHFRLAINAEEASRYYSGKAHFVIVVADNGQKIQFPARYIRRFINQLGVRGYFSIQFDDDNKLIALNRISD